MTRVGLQHLSADILGLEPWARRALATRPRPAGLPGMIVPDSPGAVPRRADDFLPEQRSELSTLLQEQLAAFGPHVNVIDSARALGQADSWAVVAGQQPGFLGGPLYDIYKAVTAIRLARALSAEWSTKVVPVFWNHADDHDVAEVHHLWIQNINLDLHRVRLAGVSSGRTPMSRIRIETERSHLASIQELLEQNLMPSENRAQAIELFMPRDGESFSNAFTRVMLELFGEQGLIVLEPDWIRAPLSRALAQLVPCDLATSLEEGSRVLQAAGEQVAIDSDQAALLFHHEDGKRRALRCVGAEFTYDGEEGSRTASELAAEIVQDPDSWSAGALLRPLVQDMALPCVAYVGGWGELAYHAQLPPLRKRAGVPSTAFVPRLSATLLDAQTCASLDKLDLSLADALRARGTLGAKQESEEEEDAAALELRASAKRAATELLTARKVVGEVDAGLSQQVRKLASQLQSHADKIADKVNRVRANARGGIGRHQRRINNMLFPRGVPQERVHGALGVVARHGLDWIATLVEEVDPLPTEHLVITLEEEDAS